MKVRYCPNCKEYYGGGIYLIPDDNKCFYCENLLTTELNIEADEFDILYKISSDDSFLQAMIDLKEKDVIEYNLKLSHFKATAAQQESAKSDNKPKCPHCKSTNIKSISGFNRGASIAMWGIFSKKINKSFECLDCKYTW